MKRVLFAIFMVLISVSNALAGDRTVNLVVSYKTVSFAGKAIKAIAVNNQIPAPTLHFKEGDHVTINVYNHLDQETAIHWHGMLVPWQMDGVLGVTQEGIKPGSVFRYQFTLRQSGTYWYHAHAGLQEQRGLYGAFIIDPPKHPAYRYTKDYVVVLSDWSNTNPNQILANLKKEGDYYSPDFPLQPSLEKFIHDYGKASNDERRNLIDDYKMMQQMRMSIYDISDVAYDAFLLNGQAKNAPWTAPVRVGDVVRLRFIGAGGSTIFHVKIPNTTMQMVHIEGNDVLPYTVSDFRVAPGETYDVLVKIQKNEPYIIYAESIDTVGAALGALITTPQQFINYKQVAPFPEPLPVTREMTSMMMGEMSHGVSSESMVMAPIKTKKQNHANSMNMSSMPNEKAVDHKVDKPSDNQSMAEQMKLDPNMKMDPIIKNNKPEAAMTMTENNSQSMSSMANMSGSMNGLKMGHGMSMYMVMPTEPSIIGDKMSPPNDIYETSLGTKYQKVTAAVQTNDPSKPVSKVINMELFGYMDRYIWFVNGVPEHKAKPITLEPRKRYRFVFTNTSMMHHPMHIHGHWLILREGKGAYDPLLHTIDVPPGATMTADLDTDASGQWLFHCHLLYHMMSGMARVFQYSTLIEVTNGEAKPQDIVKQTPYYNRPIVRVDEVRPINPMLVTHPEAHHAGLWLSTFLDAGVDPFHNAQRLTYKGLYGADYNKLELFTNDAEVYKGTVQDADIDIFYWHLIDQFWAIKGGANYAYRPANIPYWQPGIGIEGLMPYFIDTDVRGYYYGGSFKLDVELSRDTQITNNFFIRAGLRSIAASKTTKRAAIGSGLNQMRYMLRPYYRVLPGLSVFAEYEHEQDYGSFRNIQINGKEPAIQNTLTFGISMVL